MPLQLVQSEATVNSRRRLSFNAKLPPLGYRVYHVLPRPDQQLTTTTVTASDTMLENGRFRLTFNPTNGTIASLVDKTGELEVFNGDAARAVVLEDSSDTWSHDVFTFGQVIGEFKQFVSNW